MEDINNYIKENDTDNVILNKLKELGTKLTGQENVQGETVSEVLDFINSNYSGGGSNTPINSYTLSMFNNLDFKTAETNVKSIDNIVFFNINFSQDVLTVGATEEDIQNNIMYLGYFNLTDNENNPFKCDGTMPIVYELTFMAGKNYKGFLKFTYDTSSAKNKMYLIFDKDDVQMWNDFFNSITLDTNETITINCNGIFQTVIE